MGGDPAEESFFKRLFEAKRWVGWALIVVAIATKGLGSFIQQEISPYISTLQFIWVTLPLTVAVIIITILAIIDRITPGRLVFVIIGTCAASILTGVTAGKKIYAYLFQAQYNCFHTFPNQPQICYNTYNYSHASGNPVISILAAYMHIYGFVGFVSSIIAGALLGYAFCNFADLP